jgi:hypothetical protein
MRRKKMIFALILLTAVSVIGCGRLFHPDYFRLDEDSVTPIEVFILSDIYSVEKTFYDNEFLLHDGGIAAMKKPDETTNSLLFTVTLLSGEGIRLMFRTDTKKFRDEPGMLLEWTQNGCVVKENNKTIAKVDTVKAVVGSPVRISVINEGAHFSITADCDTIIKGTTQLPNTEYYLLESLQSESTISGIFFENLYGFQPEEIILEDEKVKGKTREEIIIIK